MYYGRFRKLTRKMLCITCWHISVTVFSYKINNFYLFIYFYGQCPIYNIL